MGIFLGVTGFLTMLAGLIVFILSLFIDIPKKTGGIIAVIGFFFLNISNFPKDALYGIFGFLAIIVGIGMLIASMISKKPLKNSSVVIVIGCLAFFGALSSSTDTPQAKDETTVESAKVDAAEPQEKVDEPVEEEVIEETIDEKEEPIKNVIGIGDKIVVDDVHYVINEVTSAKNVGGEYGEEAKSQFTIINLTVQNEQDEAIEVDSDQFKLVSGDRTYEASGSAGIYANKDYDFFYTEVNPGVSLTGNIVFDIPADLKNLQLHIQNDFWGNETGVVHLQ